MSGPERERLEDENERLRAENERLRAELERQWWENHFEHCGREWPHPTGYECAWPRPAILDAAAER